MHFTSVISVIAAGASLVAASPIAQRDTVQDYNVPEGGDTTILNYALTLEFLERKFYQEGLANYTHQQFIDAGFPDPFYQNLKEIALDEETHVAYLSTALGDAAVKEATYSFPSTDAKSFVAVASVLEGVGVSAYIGAASALADKATLRTAGSILAIEARHSSYLRAALGESPIPKEFDTSLDFNQVFSLAAQFITAFADGSAALPFKAFPPLVVAGSQYPYTAGRSSVTFSHAQKNAKALGLITATTPVFAVIFSGIDVIYVPTYVTGGNSGDLKIKPIPLNALGQVYVVLSTADGSTDNKVSDANTISGVGLLEVLPHPL